MSQTQNGISVLRQSFLRRINFAFPTGSSGFFSIQGDLFSGTADKMAFGDGNGNQISVEVDPDLQSAGETDYPVIYLKEPITGRLVESNLCHESLHAYLYCNDLNKAVVNNYEEAACYTVNVLYYLMTGLTQERWATGKSAGIKKAALPVAYAILNANANVPSGYFVSPEEFQPIVSAVASVYSDNDPGASYGRLGDPPSQ